MSDVSLSEALDAVFGFNGVRQRQLALEQYSRFELVRQARKRSLAQVIDEVERAETAARQQTEDAVNQCVLSLEGAVLKEERKKHGIVGPIQMDRRYAAFLRIEDKALLLKRIEQTLAFIEARICTNTPDGVSAVYEAASVTLPQRVSRLEQMRVCAATEDQKEATSSPRPARAADKELSDAIAGAFETALGEDSSAVNDAMSDAELEQRIEAAYRAGEAARARAVEMRLQRSREAVGCSVAPHEVPKPIKLPCELVHDKAILQSLLAEVRKAFDSYSRYVRDGGLFCAFGSDNPYGTCSGWQYEDYDLDSDSISMNGVYTGSVRRPATEVRIPDLVEESPMRGGDSIDVTLERLGEFNAHPYRGILDEDPGRYVDAFWYGLKKLVQFTEESIRFDRRAWTSFVDRLQFAYAEPAGDLAVKLDEGQLEDFLGQVRACAKH